MKLINKCLDELEVYTDDREGYWLGRKSGLPFEDCFRSASIVKVLAGEWGEGVAILCLILPPFVAYLPMSSTPTLCSDGAAPLRV